MGHLEQLHRLREDLERVRREEKRIEQDAEDIKATMIRDHFAEYQTRDGFMGVFRYWTEWRKSGGSPELHNAPWEINNTGADGKDILNREMRAWVPTLHSGLVWKNTGDLLGGRIPLYLARRPGDPSSAAADIARVLDILVSEARAVRAADPSFPDLAVMVVPMSRSVVGSKPFAALTPTPSGWALAAADGIPIQAAEGSSLPLVERAWGLALERADS